MLQKSFIYIVEVIFKILTILGLLAIVFSRLASTISPVDCDWLQLFGLATPIIAIFNLIMLIYWLIALKPFIIIAIVSFVVGLSPTSKLYRLDFSKSEESKSKGISVLSYNAMYFEDNNHTNKGVEIVKRVAAYHPDIICFQEFSSAGEASLETINAHLYQQRYRRVYFGKRYTNTAGIGMAIYSRYRILDGAKMDIKEGNDTNGAMWVDVRVDKDTIRIFNLHLETTTVSQTDRVLLSDKKLVTTLDDSKISQLRDVARKITSSSVHRANQADKIRTEIEKSPYPTIVCGDFNDTANSYVYNTVRGELKDTFLEVGKGYGYSFSYFFSMLRIDYIFASKDFEIGSYTLKEELYSDHYPIEVKLRLNRHSNDLLK